MNHIRQYLRTAFNIIESKQSAFYEMRKMSILETFLRDFWLRIKLILRLRDRI